MAPAFQSAQSPLGQAVPFGPNAWAELVEQISTCARLLRRGLGSTLAPYEITESQFSILWACSKAPPAGVAQNELASALSLSAAHVSGVVEQLRKRGWIDSHRGTADRRRQLWRCTPEGRQLLGELRLAVDTMIEQGQLSSEPLDRRAALALLTSMGRAATQAAGQDSAPRLKLADLPRPAEQDGDEASC